MWMLIPNGVGSQRGGGPLDPMWGLLPYNISAITREITRKICLKEDCIRLYLSLVRIESKDVDKHWVVLLALSNLMSCRF